MSQLPIESVLPELLSGVRLKQQVVLKAEPGAGKSTHLPLQLVKQNVVSGKIIMLEPRRLAARNIAHYLASQLGEKVGETVGYRVRGETKASKHTRLEVVTEGILTRMIQSDPELDGVSLVIFDEFHERSIHADTSLSFCLEIQEALREDLTLLVMSATLDESALTRLLPEAAYIESEGRGYPIEYRYAPMSVNDRLATSVTKQIQSLLANESGSILVFLPGAEAINQVKENLGELDSNTDVHPLYGQLNFSEQQKAISPPEQGKRKVVLATNIAETSLTIEGIRIVVDSGLKRFASFQLKTGITKLEQQRIAQSSAHQRAGRAGRLEAGICVRLYSEQQLLQQPKIPTPEILRTDLSSVMLEMLQWGNSEFSPQHWLDVPTQSSISAATDLLTQLGLTDAESKLTELGIQAQSLGTDPRMAAMLLKARQESGEHLSTAMAMVALIEEPERSSDSLIHSAQRFKDGRHQHQHKVKTRISALNTRLGVQPAAFKFDELLSGTCLCWAFPDRIAKQRSAGGENYLLANGHGAQVDLLSSLSQNEFLVVVDLMKGRNSDSKIHFACPLDSLPEHLIKQGVFVYWDDQKGELIAEARTSIGAIVLEAKPTKEITEEQKSQALLNHIKLNGLDVLCWSDKGSGLLNRIRCAREWLSEESWPDVSDSGLVENLDKWLLPFMNGVSNMKALKKVDMYQALNAYLGWPLNQSIDEWLPERYPLPTGQTREICYQEGKPPHLSARVQEVFGEQASPRIAKGKIAVTLELLSPARRPIQITQDLAAFWQGSYHEVKKEMKGRYPKHPWPDDPANHEATTKTKRQLNS
ncbi:ATP-dependent RNA helicase hrpB [Vibrio nigripulchritudo SFn27]|uniref:ATP-dependent RNA helicase hrpB n=1 Tax=Vibrio nigripulchritudo TaxID=28173 RepID=U4K8G4_9VIBR|nr:ATP-dependent helicase HrpB [Vibrio nigripulchritudo]CCN84726.1 ATP-dependent RNA helicase hrpB [Vibrio nigripulchritudo BLFn1]CCN87782.1 ATP-dependent RNA helicase hrpB [Vibrio nigripulchritudo SFn27]CCN95723.1 ATP-dependent RNA helicase hrpB [Vibrio nigripulchritudo ENn2]CCO38879.1 ATP-dependent RNA helicase hrpB [Vibrio nigripulchritudo SFn135]CCO51839.1 ATP-dependent RNA helicase hrpB [Vibrio nigripulchritudo Wn13]